MKNLLVIISMCFLLMSQSCEIDKYKDTIKSNCKSLSYFRTYIALFESYLELIEKDGNVYDYPGQVKQDFHKDIYDISPEYTLATLEAQCFKITGGNRYPGSAFQKCVEEYKESKAVPAHFPVLYTVGKLRTIIFENLPKEKEVCEAGYTYDSATKNTVHDGCARTVKITNLDRETAENILYNLETLSEDLMDMSMPFKSEYIKVLKASEGARSKERQRLLARVAILRDLLNKIKKEGVEVFLGSQVACSDSDWYASMLKKAFDTFSNGTISTTPNCVEDDHI